MKRVCFYCVASHLGGAERSTLDLILGLRRSGRYEPWALLPSLEGSFADALRAAGVPVEALPMPPGFFRISRDKPFRALLGLSRSVPGLGLYFMRLVRAMKLHRTRLIHTTGIKCHLLAALLLPIHRRPVLWHVRDILRKGPVLSSFQGVYRAAAGAFPGKLDVVFNSAASAEPFDLRAPSVIHNGLDPARYPARRGAWLRERFGIPADAPVVGVLGVFARWKGQVEFIRMAGELARRGSDAHFVLVGGRIYDTVSDLDYERELHREAAGSGIPGRIHFTGYLEDPLPALSSLDVLVHASTRPEPFGRVILEAMACGVPVAASGAGGVLELIQDGRNGVLFGPGDVAGMAAAVSRLLGDRAEAAGMAAQARLDFEKGFTIEAHVSQVEEVYSRMLGSAKS